MSGAEPLIRATALLGLDEVLARAPRPVSLDDLLAEVGIEGGLPREAGIELRLYCQLLEIASERSGIECFGLAFAEAYPLKGAGVLGYLIFNAPDLRTFVRCLARYARLQIEAMVIELEEGDGVARLTWNYDASLIGPRRLLTEFVMALFVKRARQIFDEDWLPLAGEFEYRPPSNTAEYHPVFGRSLRFEARRNALTFRSDILSRRSLRGDEHLFEILRKSAERELEDYAKSTDIVARVSEQIVEALPLQGIDLASAAEALDMTPRQLQARLKDKDTSFEAELGQVRRRLAMRYLRDTDMAMTDIALLLGFSELSSFTRAARQWFGMPPSQYRDELRRRGTSSA